jgi:hypothetical protein
VSAILSAYRQLIDALPTGIPLVVSAVLPVDEQGVAARERSYLRNAAIRELDVGLHALCASRSVCTYADATPLLVDLAGNLAAPLSRGDGWHLGPERRRRRLDKPVGSTARPRRSTGRRRRSMAWRASNRMAPGSSSIEVTA